MKVSAHVFAFLTVSMMGGAAAFVPPMMAGHSPSLGMSSESAVSNEDGVPVVSSPPAPSKKGGEVVAFGWTPDSNKPCWGLPGAIEPLGFFDPLGLSKDADLDTVKRYREAEVMHGRVAMLATVGYLIAENTPTIMYHGDTLSPMANNQLAETPVSLILPLFVIINVAEAWRSINGWVDPQEALWTLRKGYYPGAIGFDFAGWAPQNDSEAFARMATRELSNGRLAMIAAAGMCVQELVTDQPLFGY
jgi:Chlorophyll A-B binding protein